MHVQTLYELRDGNVDVEVRLANGGIETIYGVSSNVVRCAIGDSDMEYLLESNFEEMAFPLSESDYKDFKENSY